MTENSVPKFSEPPIDQCAKNQELYRSQARVIYCTLNYPQLGGYCGRAIVYVEGGFGACFDAEIYHDGKFPFDDGCIPVELHHCNAGQFIQFGLDVLERQVDLIVEEGQTTRPEDTQQWMIGRLEDAQRRLQALIERARATTPSGSSTAATEEVSVPTSFSTVLKGQEHEPAIE